MLKIIISRLYFAKDKVKLNGKIRTIQDKQAGQTETEPPKIVPMNPKNPAFLVFLTEQIFLDFCQKKNDNVIPNKMPYNK